ncbi:hypothetical protein GOV05_04870 [Candidatus Woesearchaeota archaeon]|nr:hypothetical protein [Candidatus Woesearchaeota archaeon]
MRLDYELNLHNYRVLFYDHHVWSEVNSDRNEMILSPEIFHKYYLHSKELLPLLLEDILAREKKDFEIMCEELILEISPTKGYRLFDYQNNLLFYDENPQLTQRTKDCFSITDYFIDLVVRKEVPNIKQGSTKH